MTVCSYLPLERATDLTAMYFPVSPPSAGCACWIMNVHHVQETAAKWEESDKPGTGILQSRFQTLYLYNEHICCHHTCKNLMENENFFKSTSPLLNNFFLLATWWQQTRAEGFKKNSTEAFKTASVLRSLLRHPSFCQPGSVLLL